MTALTAYIVCGSQSEAESIAAALVEERLAACVNILAPCQSIYRWEGKIESGSEVPMLAKTTQAKADALIMHVTELHSYDNPAITLWPIERLPAAYGDWIEAETGRK
ncbi:divalent-cation tolerance protein CutA [Sphingomicrobium marinum]|uniref:divalent-cation tolerance protein CutA n=1 Tax=Sphingomicrobium marinum TaxID=1227950 RepID=UPI00223FC3F1|nr:divalent-cation tolerance protein CutA [Sphingomicrobium marinum]